MATAIQTIQSSSLTAQTRPAATTAAVREHACLFTHDLRRKQKRWQDGRLKYHTFNRRVMVYDDRGNFVGDVHWRHDYDLDDGEDLELERGGIMVQVGECVGRRDQDLSDLIDKRAQERAQRQAAAAARRPPAAPVTPLHGTKPPSLRQKHLHDVIGAPSGHHGRAVVPTESPYEERQQRQTHAQAQASSDDARPAKRQRRDISPPSKSGYAQNLFGATLTLSGPSLSQASTRHRPSQAFHILKEATPPPSSSASNQNDDHSLPVNAVLAPSVPNVQMRSPGRAPPPVSDAYTSMKGFDASRSSKVVEPLRFTKPGPFDESREATTSLKQHKQIAGQIKDSIPKSSSRDPLSISQNPRKPREIEATKRANSRTKQASAVSTPKVPKKSQTKRGVYKNDILEDMPKDHETIDITEDPPQAAQNDPIQDQPRTELRIRPRKKRGLLMIAERRTIRSPSPGPKPAQTIPDFTSQSLSLAARSTDAVANTKHTKTKRGISQHTEGDVPKKMRRKAALPQDRIDENSDDNDTGYGRRRRQSTQSDNVEHLAHDDGLGVIQCHDQPSPRSRKETRPRTVARQDDVPSYPSEGTGRRLRPKKQLLDKDTPVGDVDESNGRLAPAREEDDDIVDEVPAPRLAKLGRKNIKSREVIGFIFDDEPEPTIRVGEDSSAKGNHILGIQPGQNIVSQRCPAGDKAKDDLMISTTVPDAKDQRRAGDVLEIEASATLPLQTCGNVKSRKTPADFTVQSENALPMGTTIATKQHNRSITNPATRGRKAAKPSDAAGQMPVCPLPAESARSLPVHQTPRTSDAQGNLDTESTASMPGFSRANGGPWSREAQDLFEFKRPP
ncbi:hypothetical protein F4777DRAFT_153 [Nemania sp. FL0916]|nr:hypothetical protein F4777DRAFT_153 [Nemania sp. FL0916]